MFLPSLLATIWFVIFILLILLLFFSLIWIWRIKKIRKNAKKNYYLLQKIRAQIIQEQKKLSIEKKRIKKEEQEVNSFFQQLLKRQGEESSARQSIFNTQNEIQNKLKRIEEIKKEITEITEKTTDLNVSRARDILLSLVREELEPELDNYKAEMIKKTKDEAKKIGTDIICCSLEKLSADLVYSKSTSTVVLEDQNLVSRIIGKDGRNINVFRKITGTDLVIEKEEEKQSWILQVSCFNLIRREKAYQTLLVLVERGRISPVQIEQIYKDVTEQLEELIKKEGETVLQELKITRLHPELTIQLGKLKYRTSYGQNVLAHSVEVAKIAGNIAAELGLNVELAKRAGLLHDIGKSMEESNDKLSHVALGVILAQKYNEPKEVVNAIASHHHDTVADNYYSLITIAADKLSAARTGARGYQLEAYVERMNNLEKIAEQFPGVQKSYSFHSGREIWVMVDPNTVDDCKIWKLSREIKKKIEDTIIIPGEITIFVVREKRVVRKIKSNDLH